MVSLNLIDTSWSKVMDHLTLKISIKRYEETHLRHLTEEGKFSERLMSKDMIDKLYRKLVYYLPQRKYFQLC